MCAKRIWDFPASDVDAAVRRSDPFAMKLVAGAGGGTSTLGFLTTTIDSIIGVVVDGATTLRAADAAFSEPLRAVKLIMFAKNK